MTASTKLAQVREQISALFEEGLEVGEIADRLGMRASRVDEVLDQLEAAGQTPARLTSVPVPKPEAAPIATPEPEPCGTKAGYLRHGRHSEKPCDACREAYNATRRGSTPASTGKRKPPARQKVQVHWLIPRGATMDGAHLEYAVIAGGRTIPCSFETAEVSASLGEKVLSRWATDWRDAQ